MSPLPNVRTGSEEPLYNIGAVTRMTGISMATLRAWERRYDFPEAKRSAGGHRLYAEKDVFRLQWVKERIDEGMQTSQAIQALRHQEESGHLDDQVEESSVAAQAEGAPQALVVQERLEQALFQRNLSEAERVLGEALAFSSPEDLILRVITPVFARIGEAWQAGEISVAVEHLATNYLRQRLLMWMLSGPPPRPVKPLVLACAPEEWHEGSLLILGTLLRRRRWPVAYLGQAVPLPDLADLVQKINPRLVVLVAMREPTAENLLDWPRWLPQAAESGAPVIGFGGRVFTFQPEWQQRLAGTYLGDTLEEGLAAIERLLADLELGRG